MKRILLLSIILILITSVFADINTGLVAYYPFNETVVDQTLNGNDGENLGAVFSTDRFGNENSALYFNGDAFVKIDDSEFLTPDNYTINVWYKATELNIGEIIDKGISEHYYQIQYLTTGSEPKIEFWYEDEYDNDYQILSNVGAAINQYFMATMTFDSNGNILKAYINGQLIDTESFTVPPYDNNGDLRIGRGDDGYFEGYIDDVRVYDRVLDIADIQELYHQDNWDVSCDFTVDNQSSLFGSTVNFTDLSDGAVDSWEWDFDNDGIIDSTEQNPSCFYDAPGTYSVSLTVNWDGVSSTTTKEDYVTIEIASSPYLFIDINELAFGNVSINDTATLSLSLSNYGGSDLVISNILSSTNKFNVTAEDRDVNLVINSMETVSVDVNFTPTNYDLIEGNLIILSNDVNNQFQLFPVSGQGYDLIANFTNNVWTGDIPFDVAFTSSSQGDLISYLWDFGDGQISNEENPVHTYNQEGLFDVSLTISDKYHSKTKSMTNYIEAIAHPILDFSDDNGINFGLLYLTDSSPDSTLIFSNIGTKAFQITDIQFSQNQSAFNYVFDSLNVDIEPNSSVEVLVNFFPQHVGSYSDSLIVYNTSENNHRIAVPLKGICEYAPPKIPENVQVSFQNSNALIEWDDVTENIYDSPVNPAGYIVYYSEISNESDYFFYLGFTEDTSFTHYRVGDFSNYMFYKVVAYVDLRSDVIRQLKKYQQENKRYSKQDIEKIIK